MLSRLSSLLLCGGVVRGDGDAQGAWPGFLDLKGLKCVWEKEELVVQCQSCLGPSGPWHPGLSTHSSFCA